MKNMKNSVQIIGNVGRTPEVRELQGGNLVARFSVATHESIRTGDGKKESTQWHNVVAWGATADYIRKNVEKGMPVALEGKLTNRTWEDTEGKKHQKVEITVHEILLTGARVLKPVQD